MKFDCLFEAGFKELGVRFFLVSLLPTLMFAMLVAGLYASGAPQHPPSWPLFVASVNAFDVSHWVGLMFAVLLLALASQPLQLLLVRWMEGYWGDGPARSFWRDSLVERQAKRYDSLKIKTEAEGAPTPAQLAIMGEAAHHIAQHFPDRDRLLPTSLGNALRAAEDLATRRYGLDTITLWPRLYLMVSPKLAAALDSARNQLDFSARMAVMLEVSALAAGAMLRSDPSWWWLPPGLALLGWLTYRSCVEAAVAYGAGIQTAVDLHRFDVLKALHIALPKDAATEREAFEKVSDFLRQGIPHDQTYEHSKPDAKANPMLADGV